MKICSIQFKCFDMSSITLITLIFTRPILYVIPRAAQYLLYGYIPSYRSNILTIIMPLTMECVLLGFSLLSAGVPSSCSCCCHRWREDRSPSRSVHVSWDMATVGYLAKDGCWNGHGDGWTKTRKWNLSEFLSEFKIIRTLLLRRPGYRCWVVLSWTFRCDNRTAD